MSKEEKEIGKEREKQPINTAIAHGSVITKADKLIFCIQLLLYLLFIFLYWYCR